MKRAKICNIVVASICFLMPFIPLKSFKDGYVSIISLFFMNCRYYEVYFRQFIGYLWLFLIVLACLSVALLVTIIFKDKLTVKIAATISVGIYVILWIIELSSIRFQGAYILLLLLYIALLLAIVALTTLQYLQYLPYLRRPTKTERMQAKMDYLQQQIDELKKGD